MQLKKAGELRRNDRIRYHGNDLIVTRAETFPGDPWEEDPATYLEAVDLAGFPHSLSCLDPDAAVVTLEAGDA
jgi:hypothetical protein